MTAAPCNPWHLDPPLKVGDEIIYELYGVCIEGTITGFREFEVVVAHLDSNGYVMEWRLDPFETGATITRKNTLP